MTTSSAALSTQAPNDRKRITVPFYALTWEKALQDFHDGLLTPRGLIYCHFAINLRPGAEATVDVEKLCKELGIHEATYYRAIGALKARGRLNVRRGEMIVGVPETQSLSTQSQMCDSDSQTCENKSQICDSDSQTCDFHLHMRENRNEPKPIADQSSRKCANVPNRSTNNLNEQRTEVPTTHPVSPDIDRGGFGTSPTDPLEADVEGLLSLVRDSGVRPNKTISETIASLHFQEGSGAARKTVENALSALVEQQQQGKVRNPGGFITAALKRGFTANQAKRAARERSSPPPAAPPLNLCTVAAAVDGALFRGDRQFALLKLNDLWTHGYAEQVEELCLLRKRDWGFRITAGGVGDG